MQCACIGMQHCEGENSKELPDFEHTPFNIKGAMKAKYNCVYFERTSLW